VERQITQPLERELNGTPGLISLRSESYFGLSMINLVFNDDAKSFTARRGFAASAAGQSAQRRDA
jgi:cobalt-zinc-cadmium resistance protein CzcA